MKKALLNKFLGRGIMVSPEAAAELTEEDYERALLEPRPTVLDMVKLREIRKKQKITAAVDAEDRKEITAKDFLEHYKNKIGALGPFIISKLDEKPVSINKMRAGQRNTILGMVREPEENKFYLEDLTGRCAIVTKTPQDVKENDVVAAAGTFTGQRLFADRVAHPELPIKRAVKTAGSGARFYFGRSEGKAEETADKICSRGAEACAVVIDTGGKTKKLIVTSSKNGAIYKEILPARPARLTFDVAGKPFKVQFLQATKNEPIGTLARSSSKRRYVLPENPIPAPTENANVIDEDTDFVFLGESQQSGFVNHKGYTFITVADRFVVIDLQTRSAALADF